MEIKVNALDINIKTGNFKEFVHLGFYQSRPTNKKGRVVHVLFICPTISISTYLVQPQIRVEVEG